MNGADHLFTAILLISLRSEERRDHSGWRSRAGGKRKTGTGTRNRPGQAGSTGACVAEIHRADANARRYRDSKVEIARRAAGD